MMVFDFTEEQLKLDNLTLATKIEVLDWADYLNAEKPKRAEATIKIIEPETETN